MQHIARLSDRDGWLIFLEGFVIVRAAASVIVAGAIVLGASGCSFFAPQATLIHYEPSDGVAVNVGEIKARNIMAISEDGKTANLVMTIVNEGDTPETVKFVYASTKDADADAEVDVQRDSSTSIGYGPDDKSVTLTDLDVTVGSLISVWVQYGSEEGVPVLVPVLDGSQPQYATLVPTDN
jgi:hypothetical protein